VLGEARDEPLSARDSLAIRPSRIV